MNSPELEQSICITCGFCCDGTLFDHAILQPGEKGHLPQYMEDNYTKTKEKEFFLLPCDYFNGKCSIYNEKKALVCSSFRCLLLKDFSENKIDVERALEIVKGGKSMREEIFEIYSRVFPEDKESLNFRSILKKIVNYQRDLIDFESEDIKLKMLIGKCNIYETLSIKYFRSKSEYNQMMADDESKNAN